MSAARLDPPLPALLALLFLALASCSPDDGVPILLWHAVDASNPRDPRNVPPTEFDAELSLLEARGITPITLSQLFDARGGKGTLPARSVVLTFDDGRECLYDQAMPVLVAHHMTGEVFLVTDFLADGEANRVYRDEGWGTHGYLLNSEVDALQSSGAFVLESHSVRHRPLDSLSPPFQTHELEHSRATLHKRFGAAVDFFAYPFGAYGLETPDLVEQAGYRGALAVGKGPDTSYAMLRFSLWRGDLKRLDRMLTGRFGTGSSAPPR